MGLSWLYSLNLYVSEGVKRLRHRSLAWRKHRVNTSFMTQRERERERVSEDWPSSCCPAVACQIVTNTALCQKCLLAHWVLRQHMYWRPPWIPPPLSVCPKFETGFRSPPKHRSNKLPSLEVQRWSGFDTGISMGEIDESDSGGLTTSALQRWWVSSASFMANVIRKHWLCSLFAPSRCVVCQGIKLWRRFLATLAQSGHVDHFLHIQYQSQALSACGISCLQTENGKMCWIRCCLRFKFQPFAGRGERQNTHINTAERKKKKNVSDGISEEEDLEGKKHVWKIHLV